MEGMLEVEAQRLELERRQVRRNTLQLVSAVAQWIILLAFLVYIALGFLHPRTTQSSQSNWIEVGANGYIVKEKRINISKILGPMKVKNLSIPIYCDGFYLVSLKGTINSAPSQRNASLILKVYQRSETPILRVKITEDEMVVNVVTVSRMWYKDEVYLEANRDANYKGLTLGLVLLVATEEQCFEDVDKM